MRSLAGDVLERARADDSRFALRPADTSMLDRLGMAVHAYAQFGANSGTLKLDGSIQSVKSPTDKVVQVVVKVEKGAIVTSGDGFRTERYMEEDKMVSSVGFGTAFVKRIHTKVS